MITVRDFKTICRLCLRKDQGLVGLFSKTPFQESTEENDAMLVSDVESFCKIKIIKGDGLPEHICNKCLNGMLLLHELRNQSLKSNCLLHEIVNSHVRSLNSDSSMTKSMEFIDTETHSKMEDSDIKNRSFIEREWTELKDTKIEAFRQSAIKISSVIKLDCNKQKDSETKKTKIKKKKIRGTIRKVSCEMCGKLVPAYFIEFHLNLHKDIRPYKCEVEDCHKYFVAPTHAKNHYTKVHVNGIIKPFKCEICKRGFNQKSSLSTHRTYHFDPQIPCKICGKFYRNKRAIKKHLLVHSGERNYNCSECQKSFQTKSTLSVHMRTHSLEKPYSCSECTKTFAYKCLLKGHTEKHHPK